MPVRFFRAASFDRSYDPEFLRGDLMVAVQPITTGTIMAMCIDGIMNGPESQVPIRFSCSIPLGSYVVPFCGLYLEPYKMIPKRNY